MSIGNMIQTADWKTEKHVPVIEYPDTIPSGDYFELKVSLGKEIAHPNTTEHHIKWIFIDSPPELMERIQSRERLEEIFKYYLPESATL